jgi:hypothetical protein
MLVQISTHRFIRLEHLLAFNVPERSVSLSSGRVLAMDATACQDLAGNLIQARKDHEVTGLFFLPSYIINMNNTEQLDIDENSATLHFINRTTIQLTGADYQEVARAFEASMRRGPGPDVREQSRIWTPGGGN